MAVKSIFFSDRDGMEKALSNPKTMTFATKAQADERDKLLQFSEELMVFLTDNVDGLGDELAEKCSLVIAENRELIRKAIKKPEILNASPDTEV